MESFDVWNIVKVPFPYTNRPVRQYRPALVVARHAQRGSPALLWVLMITSASHRRWVGDIEIANIAVTGLPAASIVRSAKIASVEASETARIGVLSKTERPAVRLQLAGMLGAILHTDAPAGWT